MIRYVFVQSTIWVHELSQYIFGAIFMLTGGYALLNRRHVNVDVFTVRLPLRSSAILELITSFFFFLFCGVLVWKGWQLGWHSLEIMERSSTAWAPLIFPVKLLVPLGGFLLLLQGLTKFVRNLLTAITCRDFEA
ncbi:TRAP transporter small permease subunit [Chloroflexota bacterium]